MNSTEKSAGSPASNSNRKLVWMIAVPTAAGVVLAVTIVIVALWGTGPSAAPSQAGTGAHTDAQPSTTLSQLVDDDLVIQRLNRATPGMADMFKDLKTNKEMLAAQIESMVATGQLSLKESEHLNRFMREYENTPPK